MPALTQDRAAFIAQVNGYVLDQNEREQFTQVLDLFIDWCLSRPADLVHHDAGYDQHVVSFAGCSDGAVFLSAYPRKADGAKLEVLPRVGDTLSVALQNEARALIRSVSREPITDGGTLQFPFSSLRNPPTKQRVTELLAKMLS